jgi:hypothetical protein
MPFKELKMGFPWCETYMEVRDRNSKEVFFLFQLAANKSISMRANF